MDEQDKFTWVIENFSELKDKKYSPQFVVGCCNWRLLVFPEGNKVDQLSVYLDVANSGSLPSQWRRHALFTVSVVNQLSNSQTIGKQCDHWFSAAEDDWGFTNFIPLDELKNPKKGFLLNNKLIVEAEVEVLEVQGSLDIMKTPIQAEGSSSPLVDAENVELCEDAASVENTTKPLEANEAIEIQEAKSNDAEISAGALKSELKFDFIDVNGFMVLDTQVEQVKKIFEKYPDVATNFRPKSQQLRTSYMNILLNLIESLCRSPQDITEDDLGKVSNSLIDLEDAGFKLDWLKDNFDEISKRKERAGGTRIGELEKEFEMLKLIMSDIEAALVKEKEEVAAMKVPLSFSDLISKLS